MTITNFINATNGNNIGIFILAKHLDVEVRELLVSTK